MPDEAEAKLKVFQLLVIPIGEKGESRNFRFLLKHYETNENEKISNYKTLSFVIII